MADSSSIRKTFNCVSRQRVTDTNINELSSLSNEMDSETTWNLNADHNTVVNGLNVTQATGTDFTIGAGTFVYDGEAIKKTADDTVSLDTEGTGNPRIDRIEITGVSDFKSVLDSASVVALGALTRTNVATFAVGTGTGAQEEWDLGHALVDNTTLRVLVDGTEVGGWNYAPVNGIRTKDYIIFATAPAAGTTITATYDYLTGGAEAASSQFTRNRRVGTFTVVKGTPAASPVAPSVTSGAIQLALVTIPASWTGDATPSAPTIDNSIKEFTFHPDNSNDSNAVSDGIQSGKVESIISGMSMVQHGYRLQYVAGVTDTISVSPGFSSNNGWAHRSPNDITLQLQTSSISDYGYVGGGADWYFVVGEVDTSLKPGQPMAIDVIKASVGTPTSRNIMSNSEGLFYIGAIYVSSISPIIIEPFFTEGDWVFWTTPPSYSVTAGAATNLLVSNAVPPTARLMSASSFLDVTRNASGDQLYLATRSHLSGTALASPSFTNAYEPPSAVRSYSQATGMVRCETSGGGRYINYLYTVTGTPTEAATITILGYLDDYRTMTTAGAAQLY